MNNWIKDELYVKLISRLSEDMDFREVHPVFLLLEHTGHVRISKSYNMFNTWTGHYKVILTEKGLKLFNKLQDENSI